MRDEPWVLVVGCHRSGTSALAGMLVEAGLTGPRDPMPETEANPRGYVESVQVAEVDDRLIGSLGASWDAWSPWPDPELADADPVWEERLVAAVETAYGDGIPVVKDPRVCRTFPVWARARAGVPDGLRVVLAVRHPREVRDSLVHRDGIGRTRADLIWLRHVLDAEYATRGTPRVVVDYAAVLEDRADCLRRIDAALQVDLEVEQDGFVTPELYRQRYQGAQADAPFPTRGVVQRWVFRAWTELAAAGRDELSLDDPGLRSRLDRLRGEVDRAITRYAEVEARDPADTADPADPADPGGLAELWEQWGEPRPTPEQQRLLRTWTENRRAEAFAAWCEQATVAHEMASGARRFLTAPSAYPPPDDVEQIRRSPFFHAEWYLRNYPDVAVAGLDPAAHYLTHGAAEHRDPGPLFSTRAYRAAHPGIEDRNPLL